MNRKIRRWSIYSNETFIQKIVIKPFYDQYLFISFMTRPVSLLFGMHTNPSLMFATYMCHTTDVWVYLKYFMFLVMLLMSVCKELSLFFFYQQWLVPGLDNYSCMLWSVSLTNIIIPLVWNRVRRYGNHSSTLHIRPLSKPVFCLNFCWFPIF